MATNTVILAQSGSGKSFFLGRLIEEIMLHTKARCIILDPNADFRRVREPETTSLWENARYDPVNRRGRLPDERGRDIFASAWEKIPIRIRTGAAINQDCSEPIRISWPSLSMEFFASDVEAMLHSELDYCHDMVKAFDSLLGLRDLSRGDSNDLMAGARTLFTNARKFEEVSFALWLRDQFCAQHIVAGLRSKHPNVKRRTYRDRDFVIDQELDTIIDLFVNSALRMKEFVSDRVEKFYFGKAQEYQSAGILETDASKRALGRPSFRRLDVIDLPSLPNRSTRLLVINELLTREWEEAKRNRSAALERAGEEDNRVPTFIVVDEAHNVIPEEPRGRGERALREQFRTIVAEGRKYGLFVILVSQRPDKLDRLVLSECENVAIMRLGPEYILKITRQRLGLDDVPRRVLAKCLEFGRGRALIAGRWSREGGQIVYTAARRTVESGRDLRPEHWAVPADQ